jgi:sigma-B regulation protein RsbU (phosphoserine phosphatase)
MRIDSVTPTASEPDAGWSGTGRLIKLPGKAGGWTNESGGDPDSLVPPASAPRPDRPILSVLLVEDEPGDAYLVELALRASFRPSFVVTHVTTLAAAIDHVTDGAETDVVLLDLSLPDSNGLSTVSRMQTAAPRIPIVIMTGRDDQRFAALALEAGAQDYLVKSDDPERTVGRAIRYAITRMASQIERQALLERIAQHQKILMAEIEAARAMQFDLLPRAERLDPRLAALNLEVEALFEPSSGIGGDLWGCLDCGGERICLYSFDFTGHGVGAALNVFRLHALISDHWDPRHRPSETLHLLTTALRGLLGRGHFATMFLCIFDRGQGVLEWASAGAPAPLLATGDELRFLDTRGVPLGLGRAATYRDHVEPFPPGTSLLIYSDAITDAPLPDGTYLGEAGLLGLAAEIRAETGRLSVAPMIDRLYERVGRPIEDDMTAVCIRHLFAPETRP